ncbi:efflux RND transporter periplasmic adaptor subunit [Vibrio japonicus]|uniref:Efflux RND transporter periplasmic adaptor subunit n=1 Tax=Vibrio japonicus TaxID=1824638 RepID=A0ABY5LGV1_9VIBR|nr:efflux RND transporter periplasmic adaptor subunit [Vibrio japonicus]UUM30165.1 efflux RND transporter periplasmic adaptor subunit [Vibrio japonicus]
MANFSITRFLSARPYIVSLFIICLLSLWLGLGMLKADDSPPKHDVEKAPLAKVVYSSFTASNTFKSIELYGRTAPDKQANLGAEIAGKIIQVSVEKGQIVKQGQVVALIDKGDLEIQLERARAILKVREQEYKAVQSLKNKGLQGEVAFTNAQASLVEAKAMVTSARVALRNTSVTAPFTGIVDYLYVERGDFVGVGDPVAKLIDLSNLVIEADVSERHIRELSLHQSANIKFISGEIVEGNVDYISRISSPVTNTFPIEIIFPNPEQSIPAGMSAEVTLNLNELSAIKLTPAMLALDESGNLGVKTLVENKVKFVPIQLVKAEKDGVWLTGLGDTVDVITIGQGFVRDGDEVIAVREDK